MAICMVVFSSNRSNWSYHSTLPRIIWSNIKFLISLFFPLASTLDAINMSAMSIQLLSNINPILSNFYPIFLFGNTFNYACYFEQISEAYSESCQTYLHKKLHRTCLAMFVIPFWNGVIAFFTRLWGQLGKMAEKYFKI